MSYHHGPTLLKNAISRRRELGATAYRNLAAENAADAARGVAGGAAANIHRTERFIILTAENANL